MSNTKPRQTYAEYKRMTDIASDIAFQIRMREAISRRLENPLIGINRRPGTERPRFVSHRNEQGGRMRSVLTGI